MKCSDSNLKIIKTNAKIGSKHSKIALNQNTPTPNNMIKNTHFSNFEENEPVISI